MKKIWDIIYKSQNIMKKVKIVLVLFLVLFVSTCLHSKDAHNSNKDFHELQSSTNSTNQDQQQPQQKQGKSQILHQKKEMRKFVFKNNCHKEITVGASAGPQKSWNMNPGATYVTSISSNAKSFRFWSKHDCRENDCKPTPEGWPAATLAQFSFNQFQGLDFYDISNVDANNINMKIQPIPGSFTKGKYDNSKYNCGSPACKFDINKCPKQLRRGNTCLTICAAAKDPLQVSKWPNILGPVTHDIEKKLLVCCDCGGGKGCLDPKSKYCCSPYGKQKNAGGKCYIEQWPIPSQKYDRYDKVFKSQCPDAYSWQFDDAKSTYTCVDADYQIQFC